VTTAPLDEDAALLAQTALRAAQTLDDATHPGVGYPGLSTPRDVRDVLDALARLTDGVQSTVAHLGRFLDQELDAGRLTGPGGRTGAAEVSAARAGLQGAHAASGELSSQLGRAAAAVAATTAAPVSAGVAGEDGARPA
jgi:hypothetical protein